MIGAQESAAARAPCIESTLAQVLRRFLREWVAEDPPEEPEQGD